METMQLMFLQRGINHSIHINSRQIERQTRINESDASRILARRKYYLRQKLLTLGIDFLKRSHLAYELKK